MARIISTIHFWFKYPFVMLAYLWRRWSLSKDIVPRRWLSAGEVLQKDLEMYEGEGLNKELLADTARARDELLSLIKKQLIVSFVVFVFLVAGYFNVGLDVSIGGFSLKNTRGVPEALLLVSNMLACYTLILQGNAYLLDATIKSIINTCVEPELKAIYLIRYFPHENFGLYQPFNLPYLIPNRASRGLLKAASIIFLLLLALTALAFTAANIFMLIHYLAINAKFGIWSYVLLCYILLLGLGSFTYLLVTRSRLPYLDYVVNDELELLKQINPQRWGKRLDEIYGPINQLKIKMIEQGYLKGTQ